MSDQDSAAQPCCQGSVHEAHDYTSAVHPHRPSRCPGVEALAPLAEVLAPYDERTKARKAADEKQAERLRAKARAAADGLRALAGMLEANPELAREASLDHLYVFYSSSAEEQAALVRAGLRHGAKVDKQILEEMHNVVLRWGPVGVMALAMRQQVCERVVVGTETVTKTIKDPDAVAALPDVEVSETVERVEWRCRPLLAEADKAGA